MAVVADQFQFGDQIAVIILFFNLLGYEPLQENLGSVVFFLNRLLTQVVNAGGDHLLVGQGLLQHFKQ